MTANKTPMTSPKGDRMNYRNILKIYKLERELSPDDVALLNTLRGMSDSERELFAEALAPEKPVVKPATRKIEKCGVCNYTRRAVHHNDPAAKGYHKFDDGKTETQPPQKSRRAVSLASRLGTPVIDTRAPLLCTYEIDNKVCKGTENDGIHDQSLGYGNYHPFVSDVQPVPVQSSTNGEELNEEVST